MKKFIFMMIAMLSMAISMNAQNQCNYAGSSKFTDNWSVSLQGGVLTTFDNYFTGHTAMAPVAVLSVDKYINPWFGVGVDGRTLIGTGKVGVASYNTHTAFDAVNVSGYAKFNVLNFVNGLNGVKYDGKRKFFEPVIYTGLGWGHQTCSESNPRNYMTYRAGAELMFNLGNSKAFGIVVNPSVVWGDIDNGKLNKHNGNFEVTAGVVYHLMTSNGTHSFTAAKLYDQSAIDALNARINELENQAPVIKEVVKTVTVKDTVESVKITPESTFAVTFAKNSSELTDAAKKALDKIPAGTSVDVAGATSPEGSVRRNTVLSNERAQVVADYLKARGVDVVSTRGADGGRAAVVTVAKK